MGGFVGMAAELSLEGKMRSGGEVAGPSGDALRRGGTVSGRRCLAGEETNLGVVQVVWGEWDEGDLTKDKAWPRPR